MTNSQLFLYFLQAAPTVEGNYGIFWAVGVFIANLAAILVAVGVIWKYVATPIRKAVEIYKKLDEIVPVIMAIAAEFKSEDGTTLRHTIDNVEADIATIKAQVELALENSIVPTFVMNEKGFCTYANAAWIALTGLTLDDSEGNGWIEAIHYQDRDRVYDLWQKTVKDDRPFITECRVVHLTSEKVNYVRIRAISVRNKKQMIVAYVGQVKTLRTDADDASFDTTLT